MKVYQALARAFVAEGVDNVFALMGDGNMHWLEAMRLSGVDVFDVRHEGAGLSMADGWARVARDRHRDVPGVFTATHGPGVSQLATAMLVAARARTPLVAFVGETPIGDDEFVQHLDQERFAAAVECAFVRVDSPDSADEAVRKAFYIAKSQARPVMLSATDAVQLAELDDVDDYQPSASLLNQLPPFPHPAAIAQATDVIAESRRPVVVVGRGAIWSRAGDAALELARATGALVATTLHAKGWLSQDEFHVGISGLYSTKTAIRLFEEADCVIALGASLNKYTIEHGYLYPNARYIHIDTMPNVVMGGGRTADCYVHSDVRLAAEELTKVLAGRGHQNTGYRTPDVRDRLTSALDDGASFAMEPDTVDPREVSRLLDELLPADVGLVLGGSHQATFGTMLFTKARPLMLANQHFGCVGQGLPTAIGAVIAADRQPTVLMEGDIGLMMHLAEFETAVRYGLPLLVVVNNDQALGSEYHKLGVRGMRSDFATITTPDLGAVAVSLGGRGRRCTSIDHVRAAAEEFVVDPAPTMIDVRVSKQVVSVPYRRLHYAEDV